jgi:hypothetical protein
MSKYAANEDEIGKLHKIITKCHNMKWDAVIKMAEKFEEMGAAEAVVELIDLKQMTPSQKWVEYNAVTAIAAGQDGESELGKKLRLLKEKQQVKVVSFKETGSE